MDGTLCTLVTTQARVEALCSDVEQRITLLERKTPCTVEWPQSDHSVWQRVLLTRRVTAAALNSTEKVGLLQPTTTEVHSNILCDICRVSPMVGIRFVCTHCDDFDACARCALQAPHMSSHMLVRAAASEENTKRSHTLHHSLRPFLKRSMASRDWADLTTTLALADVTSDRQKQANGGQGPPPGTSLYTVPANWPSEMCAPWEQPHPWTKVIPSSLAELGTKPTESATSACLLTMLESVFDSYGSCLQSLVPSSRATTEQLLRKAIASFHFGHKLNDRVEKQAQREAVKQLLIKRQQAAPSSGLASSGHPQSIDESKEKDILDDDGDGVELAYKFRKHVSNVYNCVEAALPGLAPLVHFIRIILSGMESNMLYRAMVEKKGAPPNGSVIAMPMQEAVELSALPASLLPTHDVGDNMTFEWVVVLCWHLLSSFRPRELLLCHPPTCLAPPPSTTGSAPAAAHAPNIASPFTVCRVTLPGVAAPVVLVPVPEMHKLTRPCRLQSARQRDLPELPPAHHRLLLFVSHAWIEKEHPDPDGDDWLRVQQFVWSLFAGTIDALAVVLDHGVAFAHVQEMLDNDEAAQLLMGGADAPMGGFVDSTVTGLAVRLAIAAVVEVVGDNKLAKRISLDDRRSCVQWMQERTFIWMDYACLPQPPRTAEEAKLFELSLASLPDLIPCLHVLVVNSQDKYLSRAWCVSEWMLNNSICSTHTHPGEDLLTGAVPWGLLRFQKREIVFRELMNCENSSPQEVLQRLQLQITNGKDDSATVCRLLWHSVRRYAADDFFKPFVFVNSYESRTLRLFKHTDWAVVLKYLDTFLADVFVPEEPPASQEKDEEEQNKLNDANQQELDTATPDNPQGPASSGVLVSGPTEEEEEEDSNVLPEEKERKIDDDDDDDEEDDILGRAAMQVLPSRGFPCVPVEHLPFMRVQPTSLPEDRVLQLWWYTKKPGADHGGKFFLRSLLGLRAAIALLDDAVTAWQQQHAHPLWRRPVLQVGITDTLEVKAQPRSLLAGFSFCKELCDVADLVVPSHGDTMAQALMLRLHSFRELLL